MKKGKARVADSREMLSVSYEDSDAEWFGGEDYEVSYCLDGRERKRLERALRADGYRGSLEKMIREHFGERLDGDSFYGYCKDRDIDCGLQTHVG